MRAVKRKAAKQQTTDWRQIINVNKVRESVSPRSKERGLNRDAFSIPALCDIKETESHSSPHLNAGLSGSFNVMIVLVIAIVSFFFLEGITGAVVGTEHNGNSYDGIGGEDNGVVEQAVAEQISEQGTADVIVLMNEDVATKESSAAREALQRLSNEGEKTIFEADKQPEFILEKEYSSINAFSGTVTEEGLKKLSENPDVKKIVANEVRRIFLADSVPLINAPHLWNITIGGINLTGSNEAVCVIDTGINYTHAGLGACDTASFLAGNCLRVVSGYDFVNNDNDPMDDHGHGTHIAGIINSADAIYRGVAPEVKIIAMKACNNEGSCTDANVIAAMEWCIYNATRYNISAISISLGSGQVNSYCDQGSGAAYAPSVNQAVGRNISVIIATGNTDGQFTNAAEGIAVPSCVANATRASATTKLDEIAGYAFRNANFSDILLAPGSSITSLKNGGGTSTLSGTSMSAPHVAAAVALLQQFSKLHNGIMLNVQQIKEYLNATGKRINDPLSGISFSRIDALLAIVSLDDQIPQLYYRPPTPEENSTVNSVFINVSASKILQQAVLEWNNVNETMDGSGTTSFYKLKTGLISGVYSFRVYGTDLENNTNSSDLRTFVFDGKPTISFSLANNSYYSANSSLTITVNNDENISSSSWNLTNSSGSIVKSGSNGSINLPVFVWNDPLADLSLADGFYTITVSATVGTGERAEGVLLANIDRNAPVFSGINVSPETIYNDVQVLFTVKVEDLNLNKSKVFFESNFSGNWTSYPMNLAQGNRFNYSLSGKSNLSQNKDIGYRFAAQDYAGNGGNSSIFIYNVQNRAPSNVVITSPLNNTLLELGEALSFTANASDADEDSLTYNWSFGGSGQSLSHAFTSIGNIAVTVEVSDSFNKSMAEIIVRVNDTKAPQLTSLSYDSEVHLQQDTNMPVTAVIRDYSGISNVTLTHENLHQNATCSKTNISWTCSWLLNGLMVGSRNFVISMSDNFSAIHSNSTSVNFIVTSCTDGSKNGNEEEIDCGGSCSNSCSASSNDAASSADAGGSSSGGSDGGSSGEESITALEETSSEETVTNSEEVTGEDDSDLSEVTSFTQEDAVLSNDSDTNKTAVGFAGRITGFFSALAPSSLTKKTLSFVGMGILALILLIIYLSMGERR